MNNRWRQQEKGVDQCADRTMRKAIKEESPSEFWAKLRVVQKLGEKAWTIRVTKGHKGIEERGKRRFCCDHGSWDA